MRRRRRLPPARRRLETRPRRREHDDYRSGRGGGGQRRTKFFRRRRRRGVSRRCARPARPSAARRRRAGELRPARVARRPRARCRRKGRVRRGVAEGAGSSGTDRMPVWRERGRQGRGDPKARELEERPGTNSLSQVLAKKLGSCSNLQLIGSCDSTLPSS